MIITIDVGNSRIKIGLFEKNGDVVAGRKLPEFIRSMAIEVDEAIPWDVLANWTKDRRGTVKFVVLGGVNPRGRDKVLDGWPSTDWPSPIVLDNPFVLPIRINVDSPRTVGVDRLLNAIAANVVRPADKPMIIVDSGTATTVDVVSQDGAFEGGAILPGFQLGSRSLHLYTALLPRISNEELARRTPRPLGKNTRDALRSGLFWGQLGAVKELVQNLSRELPSTPVLVVTGGAGRLLVPQLGPEVLHLPYLALQGLVIVGHHLASR
ncbi:MAG: type III pantothenate kinase [Calditrichaeota bacterium]|nr:MAG: type III pantothenate kinase [Calditrichota bacterium]